MRHLLRSLILYLVRLLGWPRVLLAARFAGQRTTGPARILLVRPDHLGDLLLTTPALQALRQQAPGAHITLLVGPWSYEIMARQPALDRLQTCAFPGFRRAPQSLLAPYRLLVSTARELRRDRYDLALNLRPDFWWGAALLYLAGIPRRVGYALPQGRPFLTHALPLAVPEHAAVSNLRLVSAGLVALGYQAPAEPFTPQAYPAHFVPTAEERAWARERLRAEGIADDAPLILLPPGSGGAVKLWRSQAWATCANALRAWLTSASPARILLTGSPGERALIEEIARGIPAGAVLVTDATIGRLAALMERAVCVLTVDNGPGHLAVTRGTPGVHLFGPTDPRIFGPWGDPARHIVLTSTQRCPGCLALPCGRLDWAPAEVAAHPCVRVIAEERVLEAAKRLLSRNGEILTGKQVQDT
jgi:ADP-heptose:LPS heptosyltransferase